MSGGQRPASRPPCPSTSHPLPTSSPTLVPREPTRRQPNSLRTPSAIRGRQDLLRREMRRAEMVLSLKKPHETIGPTRSSCESPLCDLPVMKWYSRGATDVSQRPTASFYPPLPAKLSLGSTCKSATSVADSVSHWRASFESGSVRASPPFWGPGWQVLPSRWGPRSGKATAGDAELALGSDWVGPWGDWGANGLCCPFRAG